MNEIKIFENNEFGQVRSTVINDEPWFCATDITTALGYANGKDAVLTHVDEEDRKIFLKSEITTLENIPNRGLTFINESGLYSLIMSSKLESAKRFKKWVTSEVLPSIRKTGQYSISTLSRKELAIMVVQAEEEKERLTLELKNSEREITTLTRQIEEAQPKVAYYDMILNNKSTVLTTQIAQDYGMSAKRFNAILRDMHIQHKVNDQWILYAKYQGKGYVSSKPVQINHADGRTTVKYNTEWTQKGRLFLYDHLKGNEILPLIEQ